MKRAPGVQPLAGFGCQYLAKLVNMRILLSFFVRFLLASCSKDTAGPGDSMLESITVDGKINERFLYNSDRKLEKFERFAHCTTSPMDEEQYHYEVGKLVKISSVSRSLYSSSFASCDPSTGVRNDQVFTYDNQGRLTKVTTANSYRDFYYNSAGRIEKQVIGGNSQHSYFYEYDARGNVTRYTDNTGMVTQYEYDNKTNPFYLAKLSPGTLIAFFMSPNNVVKGSGNGTVYFTRQFTYNSNGLPATLIESTSSTIYTFNYK